MPYAIATPYDSLPPSSPPPLLILPPSPPQRPPTLTTPTPSTDTQASSCCCRPRWELGLTATRGGKRAARKTADGADDGGVLGGDSPKTCLCSFFSSPCVPNAHPLFLRYNAGRTRPRSEGRREGGRCGKSLFLSSLRPLPPRPPFHLHAALASGPPTSPGPCTAARHLSHAPATQKLCAPGCEWQRCRRGPGQQRPFIGVSAALAVHVLLRPARVFARSNSIEGHGKTEYYVARVMRYCHKQHSINCQ